MRLRTRTLKPKGDKALNPAGCYRLTSGQTDLEDNHGKSYTLKKALSENGEGDEALSPARCYRLTSGQTDLEDNHGKSYTLKKALSENGEGVEYIVGSLTSEGTQLLSLDPSIISDRYHCFTFEEIKNVLKRNEPTTLCLHGVENLQGSSHICELIQNKIMTTDRWYCNEAGTLLSLSEINKGLDALKNKLLPSVAPRRGKTQCKGNTSSTSNAIKKANEINKVANQLKRNKEVTGEIIGAELCRLINLNPPKYLQMHVPELVEMVSTVKKKPVWFYCKKR